MLLTLRAMAEPLYKGEPLSLNFQDVEVRAVLQVLADYTGINLVASDTVQGNITLRLHEVPWDQALELVLRSRGLAKREEGNVLLVAPAAELAEQSREARIDQALEAQLQPLHRELLPIHHADASDLAKLLLESLADDEPAAGRGSLSVDSRTNTLIATQSAARLAELRQLVADLDVPVRQVMIEARIVEANVDYENVLGIRWGAKLGGMPARSGSELFVDLGAQGATSGVGVGVVRGDVLEGGISGLGALRVNITA